MIVFTLVASGLGRLLFFPIPGNSTPNLCPEPQTNSIPILSDHLKNVAHYENAYERVFDTVVAGVRINAPMLLIHTGAAGGGSICRFDQGRFQVGPESAGANPGPACYRRGGPLAVTDCNVMLGKLQPQYFPNVFGPEQNQGLDVGTVRDGFAALAEMLEAETGVSRSEEEIASGFLRIAVEYWNCDPSKTYSSSPKML